MKRLIRGIVNRFGFDYRRIRLNHETDVSQFAERTLIDGYLGRIGIKHKVCADVGAVNGVMLSNIYHLAQAGWAGAAVEYNSISFRELAWNYAQFPQMSLFRVKVTPDNILSILRAATLPSDFDFLSLDIDSYDYFVLEALLKEFRPRLICMEINPRIPPPVRFVVKYDPALAVDSDFFGCSLAQLNQLCESARYRIVGLNYVNAFLVPAEVWRDEPHPLAKLYQDGYAGRADKYVRLPHDRQWGDLLTIPPQEIVTILNQRFATFSGRYTLSAE